MGQRELQSLRAQQAALNAHHSALIAMEHHQQELLQLGEGLDPPEGGRGSWSLVPKLLRPAVDATLAAAASLGAHVTGQVQHMSLRMKTVMSSTYLELFLQGLVTITEADIRQVRAALAALRGRRCSADGGRCPPSCCRREFLTACTFEEAIARNAVTKAVGVRLLEQVTPQLPTLARV